MTQLRRLFTTKEFLAGGRTRGELRAGELQWKWRQIVWGVYGEGPDDPTPLDVARAELMRRGLPAWGLVAARIYGLDAVDEMDLPDIGRRRAKGLGEDPIRVGGALVVTPLQTMVDLATILPVDEWEQANESMLRQGLVTIDEELVVLERLGRGRMAGAAVMREALALRPDGAPPTASMLETLGIQMCRMTPGIPEPVRQFRVTDRGGWESFLDTSWPAEGAFAEYDGQKWHGQPVYDANRERRVVAATGWMSTRLTWNEVRYNPVATGRQVAQWLEQARRRSFAIR